MYATQTIETPITTSLLNRHRTPKRTQYTEIHKPANSLKLPRQQIHPNRPAQGSTQTTQFTEIPWSNPLEHSTHLIYLNTLLLQRPLGFYSMKQAVSTIYHPPPPQTIQKQQHMQKKKKLNGFQRGSLAGRHPTHTPPNHTKTTTTHAKKKRTKIEWVSTGLSSRSPPPPPPHTHTHPLPAFLFCYATSKTFEWHFPGGPMVARQCVLAGIGHVRVLYRHLLALHWYAFLGFIQH